MFRMSPSPSSRSTLSVQSQTSSRSPKLDLECDNQVGTKLFNTFTTSNWKMSLAALCVFAFSMVLVSKLYNKVQDSDSREICSSRRVVSRVNSRRHLETFEDY